MYKEQTQVLNNFKRALNNSGVATADRQPTGFDVSFKEGRKIDVISKSPRQFKRMFTNVQGNGEKLGVIDRNPSNHTVSIKGYQNNNYSDMGKVPGDITIYKNGVTHMSHIKNNKPQPAKVFKLSQILEFQKNLGKKKELSLG